MSEFFVRNEMLRASHLRGAVRALGTDYPVTLPDGVVGVLYVYSDEAQANADGFTSFQIWESAAASPTTEKQG